MQYVTDSLGGYWNAPELSNELRIQAQPMHRFRQACDIKEAYGKGRDENWLWDKVSNLSTDAANPTATLTETDTIPESDLTIYQTTGTILEHGRGIGFTHKLEQFDKYDANNSFQKALKNDWAKAIDAQIESKLDGCKIRAVYVTDTASVAFTTNGTATATNSVALDDYCVKEIVDYMEATMLAPKWDKNGFYLCIATVKSLRGLHDHLQEIWKYTQYPATGEIGSYYWTRFVRDNSGIMSSAMGNGSAFGEAYFMGSEAVIEGVSEAEHIRVRETRDYGRSKGVAWYALLGFELCWQGDPDNRVVKLCSA